jgi:hypothetical protein
MYENHLSLWPKIVVLLCDILLFLNEVSALIAVFKNLLGVPARDEE